MATNKIAPGKGAQNGKGAAKGKAATPQNGTAKRVRMPWGKAGVAGAIVRKNGATRQPMGLFSAALGGKPAIKNGMASHPFMAVCMTHKVGVGCKTLTAAAKLFRCPAAVCKKCDAQYGNLPGARENLKRQRKNGNGQNPKEAKAAERKEAKAKTLTAKPKGNGPVGKGTVKARKAAKAA
jgi:hypothetical protein